MVAKMVRMDIRPTASITAKSEPEGLHARCFSGHASTLIDDDGVMFGSLSDQSPSSGLQRRFLISRLRPSDEMEAMLPHFDQAILLNQFNSVPFIERRKHTDNSHSLSAHRFSDATLSRAVSRLELTSQHHHQRDHRYPFVHPS